MRLLKIWQANMKYQKKRAIAQKIAESCHTSSKRAEQDIYPFVKLMFKYDANMANGLAIDLDLDDAEVDYLKK